MTTPLSGITGQSRLICKLSPRTKGSRDDKESAHESEKHARRDADKEKERKRRRTEEHNEPFQKRGDIQYMESE